jgi:hypothetical protein
MGQKKNLLTRQLAEKQPQQQEKTETLHPLNGKKINKPTSVEL